MRESGYTKGLPHGFSQRAAHTTWAYYWRHWLHNSYRCVSLYRTQNWALSPGPLYLLSIISSLFLKALGNTTLKRKQCNAHCYVSWSMVAGGLAFTIPGIWILTGENNVTWWELLIVALAGTILGLLCTAFIRKHFIEEAELEFPIGESAAQTLIAGDSGGKTGAKLFGAMGFAGIYCAIRDWFAALPVMFFSNITSQALHLASITPP